ncbi:hypothetical protein KA478_04115 [Patescibacteria group bacterium]|nr:hypothetical protein [Patescibacteria group bacterium]
MSNLITLTGIDYVINAASGSSVENIDATINITYRYPYVIWHNLMQ